MKMTAIFLRVTVFAFLALYVSGFALLRHKRQSRNNLPPRTTPSPEQLKLLEDFWPQLNSRCPAEFMLCRDESYCFDNEQLCGGRDVCRDSSDDINAYCLGKTRPLTSSQARSTVTATAVNMPEPVDRARTSATASTASSVEPGKPPKSDLSDFGHPLVVAFFVLVGGLFFYVALATVCCVTHRWNAINPSP